MTHRVEQIGPCTLYLGDCLEILPTLTGVDAVISDPPYGVDWDADYTRFTNGTSERTEYDPIANDSEPFDPTPWLKFRHVVLFGANCFSDRLPVGSWLVWDKRFTNGTAFLADAEAAWMNRGHGIYIKSVTSQGFVRPEPRQHPTQKPVCVMEWCIDKCKVPTGAAVLDPFMGSGTTGVACIKTGHRFIGCEVNETYFDIACNRIRKAWQEKRSELPLEAAT